MSAETELHDALLRKDYEFLHNYCISSCGFPSELRPDIWLLLSGTEDYEYEISSHETYCSFISQYFQVPCAWTKSIINDIHRSGLVNPSDAEILFRILHAYAWRIPSVGYCQSMNLIAACCLKVLGGISSSESEIVTNQKLNIKMKISQSESDSFWLFSSMMDDISYFQNYFTPDMFQCQVDLRVFVNLFAESLPELYSHLRKYQVDIVCIVTEWFLLAFTNFPACFYLPVWDLYLLSRRMSGRPGSGALVLIRVAISLLSACSENLILLNSETDLYLALKSISVSCKLLRLQLVRETSRVNPIKEVQQERSRRYSLVVLRDIHAFNHDFSVLFQPRHDISTENIEQFDQPWQPEFVVKIFENAFYNSWSYNLLEKFLSLRCSQEISVLSDIMYRKSRVSKLVRVENVSKRATAMCTFFCHRFTEIYNKILQFGDKFSYLNAIILKIHSSLKILFAEGKNGSKKPTIFLQLAQSILHLCFDLLSQIIHPENVNRGFLFLLQDVLLLFPELFSIWREWDSLDDSLLRPGTSFLLHEKKSFLTSQSITRLSYLDSEPLKFVISKWENLNQKVQTMLKCRK